MGQWGAIQTSDHLIGENKERNSLLELSSLKKFFLKFTYLAALSLSCDTQDLLVAVCGI